MGSRCNLFNDQWGWKCPIPPPPRRVQMQQNALSVIRSLNPYNCNCVEGAWYSFGTVAPRGPREMWSFTSSTSTKGFDSHLCRSNQIFSFSFSGRLWVTSSFRDRARLIGRPVDVLSGKWKDVLLHEGVSKYKINIVTNKGKNWATHGCCSHFTRQDILLSVLSEETL